ncbi:MAG: TlpA family protein disulfide reductase [Gammaproteobacteria bacterium]|jgi:thiol-disulfide isomerase/thioredoxin|nr:TlpA family protein disulfide reductase [Gammaproteobacteria bacterium]MDH3750072.1 TlpA family protein disulfide reductase [Gammaproteobacteria bacterium]MDH3805629.1 TlpA family protein disulfide reductase [Gammaproteobacteria bacterium]
MSIPLTSGCRADQLMRRLAVCIVTLILIAPGGFASAEAPFDLAEYRGKVVIVDFWASWCVPCRRSFPWLNSMHDKYTDDGLEIIGVNLDAKPAAAAEFLAEYPPSFNIIYDETKELAKSFDVVAMPSSFLIGPDGEVRKRHYGFKVKKQDEYEAAIVEALSELE